MDAKVQAFLAQAKEVSNERFEIISTIREAFLASHLGFVEGFKYGGPTYNRSGELIGGIYSYKEHVSIEFSHGATFSDPQGALEGNGKNRRHIKIKQLSDIESKHIAFYINQCA